MNRWQLTKPEVTLFVRSTHPQPTWTRPETASRPGSKRTGNPIARTDNSSSRLTSGREWARVVTTTRDVENDVVCVTSSNVVVTETLKLATNSDDSFRNKARTFQNNMDDDIFNSDLVRSLDRRSSKQRRQRRKNNKKNKKVETDEELRRRRERKAKKQQEKEERRRKRKEGKEQRRLLNRQRRKEMREKKRREEDESTASVSVEKRHTLRRVRSVTPSPDSGKCQVKLIETCAFPHCNPSCPKLKNPETGKHIFYWYHCYSGDPFTGLVLYLNGQ